MTTQDILTIETIGSALGHHQPDQKPVNERGHAAVAMLLREGRLVPEVLFIIRAKHERDPWSGNIGFPGGRLDHSAELPHQAAERETLEELSYDLGHANRLGRLDDLYGAIMPVLVSCFVYHVAGPVALSPNHEVERTFWCPLTKLLEPHRHRRKKFYYRGLERTHPVVELLDRSDPLLWGITYRLLQNFFTVCGQPFGQTDAHWPEQSRVSL
jgi:8-oxo-dGTP pyrophosphatase MutT (NUDIX family)